VAAPFEVAAMSARKKPPRSMTPKFGEGDGIAGLYFSMPAWWREGRRAELRRVMPPRAVYRLCGESSRGRL
jgi:hypothetical protein